MPPLVTKLGDQLWVVLVQARPKNLSFAPGWTYGYDLAIGPAGGTPLRLRDVVRNISYRPFDCPTFTIASGGTNRIVHDSPIVKMAAAARLVLRSAVWKGRRPKVWQRELMLHVT